MVRVGSVEDDYMAATAHIAGGQDIHFKMYLVNKNESNYSPLDRVISRRLRVICLSRCQLTHLLGHI
jgi:hypothetical protein